MSKSKLGKGLGEILGEVSAAYEKEIPQNEIVELDIDTIRKNPFQPRKEFNDEALKELAESIKEHGLIQPVVVVEDIDGYMLIAGERRVRASKLAGLKKIKAIIAKIDKNKYREFALIENIQREDLSPLELAVSYKELIEEYGITHEDLSHIVKKSRTHITNTLRLLQLSDYAKEALKGQKITAGHAKVLIGLDEKEQKLLVDSIIGQKLSVRDVEKLTQLKKGTVSKSNSKQKEQLKTEEIVERLKELGFLASSKVNSVHIKFHDQSQIDNFMKYFS